MRHLRKFNSGRIFEASTESDLQQAVQSNKKIVSEIESMSKEELVTLIQELGEIINNPKINEGRRYKNYGRRVNEASKDSLNELSNKFMATGLSAMACGLISGLIAAYVTGEDVTKLNPAKYGGDDLSPSVINAPEYITYREFAGLESTPVFVAAVVGVCGVLIALAGGVLSTIADSMPTRRG